mgnify:CR=1 FL=1
MDNQETLTPEQSTTLINTLKTRFEKNGNRHPELEWSPIKTKLEANPKKLVSLFKMEATGGEPDVIEQDPATGEYVFYDCAPESPKGRRSICYDPEARAARKKFPPEDSALGMASEMGINLLDETAYFKLQQTGNYDQKTSSWVATPDELRQLGGALFGDRRWGRVFIYHNGAESYYASRGFRGMLKV